MSKVTETINAYAQWQPDQLTDEELLQAMIDTDTLPAVHDTGGILTDENGRIILW